MLKWLTNLDKHEIKEVSKLHQELLPSSPILKLGTDFMLNFYYSELIKNKLIKCLVCKKDSKIIGFVVITKYPQHFMFLGFLKSPIKLFFILIKAIMKNPLRLILVMKTIILGLKRQSSNIPINTSEIISIGVIKEYRKYIVPNSGLKVSNYIFRELLESLIDQGQKYLQVITEKSNVVAIKFYKRMGMSLINSKLCDQKDSMFKISL